MGTFNFTVLNKGTSLTCPPPAQQGSQAPTCLRGQGKSTQSLHSHPQWGACTPQGFKQDDL